MSIYDIAKLAGVSIATVSRVIHQKNVRDNTKVRVLSVVEKYHYRPHPYAQYLARQRMLARARLIQASKTTPY